MWVTPDELRRSIGRNKTRSIATAALSAVAWLFGFVLLAKFTGPLDHSWMIPLMATFLMGGLGAMILPVYLMNRHFAPRCPVCREYLSSEEIADVGQCPRCHACLFSGEEGL